MGFMLDANTYNTIDLYYC